MVSPDGRVAVHRGETEGGDGVHPHAAGVLPQPERAPVPAVLVRGAERLFRGHHTPQAEPVLRELLAREIGIADLGQPDYGDPVEVKGDELPVFWACGVTPQCVAEAVKPPFFIAHYPGFMLVTDIPNASLAVM